MRTFFDWSRYPEISALVKQEYTKAGPRDLARQIATRFQVHLEPHQIRKRWRVLTGENAEYHRRQHRKEETAAVAAPDTAFRNQNEKLSFAATRLPLGVCFTADWQVGTNGVLMRQLREDARAIATAEGLHAVLMGDLIQNLNMVKHPSSMHEMTLTDPTDQLNCVRLLIHEILGEKPIDPTNPKILGAVTGNHEHNSKKAAGIDVTRGLCEEFGIPYLWHGGLLEIMVGESRYEIGLRHLYRGESNVNTTNAQRMMYQNWQPADVEVLAHRHYNDMQKRPMVGGDTIFLRAGSYQKWDDHAQFSGGYKGSWGIPLIVLMPDTRRIIPFYGSDFYLGLEFLADQRKRYRERHAC